MLSVDWVVKMSLEIGVSPDMVLSWLVEAGDRNLDVSKALIKQCEDLLRNSKS